MHVQIAGSMHLGRVLRHCREGVRHRFIHFVIDFDFVGGLARVECRVGYYQRENIAHATGGFANRDKNRQVGNRETRAALSRNIGRGEDPFYALAWLAPPRYRSPELSRAGADSSVQRRAASQGHACRPRKAFRPAPVRFPDIAKETSRSHSRASRSGARDSESIRTLRRSKNAGEVHHSGAVYDRFQASPAVWMASMMRA